MLCLPRFVRTLLRAAVIAAVLMPWAAPAADAIDALVLHRVFLADGTALVSYGEYARVGDRVVFSMLIDPDPSRRTLQLVSVPDGSVDWPRTEEYTDTLRRNVYVATRAEADFAAMRASVVQVLDEIRTAADPGRAIEMARQLRETLMQWPRANYGYRDEEVREIAGLLDEAISALETANGVEAFDLSLVAMARRPPPVPLLRRPTLREAIEQALAVSRLTPEPVERVSLMRAVVALIDERDVSGDDPALAGLRAEALRTIAEEGRIDAAYADVGCRMLALAASRAEQVDVNGVEGVVKHLLWYDDRLGRQRPQVVAALLAALDLKLGATRQLLLEREAREARRSELERYRQSIAGHVQAFGRATALLQEIRDRRRPGDRELEQTAESGARAVRALSVLPVPDECRPVHALLISAFQLASSAGRLRREDRSPDSRAAWDASSAAAGALLLAQRASEDLNRVMSVPGPR